ncbi:MAG TPA: hypothetical protein DEV64_04255 [Rhodospirillaceae bacterium]|nr:hypothetical protein [Rhodospirillaceae bacterium]
MREAKIGTKVWYLPVALKDIQKPLHPIDYFSLLGPVERSQRDVNAAQRVIQQEFVPSLRNRDTDGTTVARLSVPFN